MPVSVAGTARALVRLGLVLGIVAVSAAVPPDSLTGAAGYGIGVALAVAAGLGSGTSP